MIYLIFGFCVFTALVGLIIAFLAFAVHSGLMNLKSQAEKAKESIDYLLNERARLADVKTDNTAFAVSLGELDDRLNLCLTTYNEAATQFNKRCENFPDSVFAGIQRFEKLTLLNTKTLLENQRNSPRFPLAG